MSFSNDSLVYASALRRQVSFAQKMLGTTMDVDCPWSCSSRLFITCFRGFRAIICARRSMFLESFVRTSRFHTRYAVLWMEIRRLLVEWGRLLDKRRSWRSVRRCLLRMESFLTIMHTEELHELLHIPVYITRHIELA